MNKALKRITANIPSDLLREAVSTTGRGITDTLVFGLQLVRQTRAYAKGLRLKGKLKLKLDLDQLRERPHH